MAHPKGILIERLQRQGLGPPGFDTRSSGPDHEPTFISDVVVESEILGSGQGGSKRDAERRAAEDALARLRQPAPADHAFEGPWPIFEQVLAASLTTAQARIDESLRGDEARDAIRSFALRLYREVLEDLGEVAELPDDA